MNREVYFRIEPAIRTLVATLNAHGYRTYASCQGHGFPVVYRPPYVAFLCSHQDAVWLARKLRKDAESYTPGCSGAGLFLLHLTVISTLSGDCNRKEHITGTVVISGEH